VDRVKRASYVKEEERGIGIMTHTYRIQAAVNVRPLDSVKS
jgi:hypothetical protein